MVGLTLSLNLIGKARKESFLADATNVTLSFAGKSGLEGQEKTDDG
jgi:hypothetical protein